MKKVLLTTVATFLFSSSFVKADPAPFGSRDADIMQDYKDWIEHQNSSDGQYCCNIADGRPLEDTEIRVVDDHYEIFFSKAHWSYGTDKWVEVRKGALLTTLSPVGYVIAWIRSDGYVWCLALTGAS